MSSTADACSRVEGKGVEGLERARDACHYKCRREGGGLGGKGCVEGGR